MMNGLDLFSGIGGIASALEEWVEPIAYCENSRHAQSVLLSRMGTGDLRAAPIWDDVRSLSASVLPPVDIITGGFPCQDISEAGRGRGLAGERSGLYWEIERLVRETNPKLIFLENVPAIRTRGLNAVVQSLTELRYDCRWTTVSAAEVGANHKRKRWFLLANVQDDRNGRREQRPEGGESQRDVANAFSQRLSYFQGREALAGSPRRGAISDPSWWDAEPAVGRVDNGTQFRVDCLRELGNGVVPKQVREAFMRLIYSQEEYGKD